MKVNTIFKTAVFIFVLFVSSQSRGQLMISFDGNDTKDMVASIKMVDYDGNSEKYVLKYSADRILQTLQYTGIYEEETIMGTLNYSWGNGSLQVTGNFDGDGFINVNFNLNASHCVTNYNIEEMRYEYVYNQDGYVVSLAEDGVQGTATWENGNMTEFTLGNYRRTITYGNIVNNANTDFAMLGVSADGFACLPLGKWSKNMPTNIKEYLNGKLSYDANLEYTLDDKGRVWKIIEHATEYEDYGSHSFTNNFEISYDEQFTASVTGIAAENNAEEIYDISGRKLPNVGKGLNIIRSHDGKVRKRFGFGR